MDIQDTNILVIEDNANNLKLYEALFVEEIGVREYRAYASGGSFFRWLDSNRSYIPHLILLDILLPREDGYEVLQQIRARPELRNTRVIAATASVMKTDMDKIRNAGFDGFLGKPIRVAKFEEQITRALAGEEIWDIR